MGEPDLVGFDDCDASYTEEDSDTLEHVRHRAYWAINTARGQDWEQPDRWLAFEAFVQGLATAIVQAHAQSVGTDLEEVDEQIERAVYRVEPGETTTWTAEITTAQGTTFAEGTLQPLPQDADQESDNEPAYQTPVSAGIKTLRQVAVEGGTLGALFPHWLTGPNSGKIVYSIGLLLDMATEWLVQGIQQRFPLVADAGALPHLGRDLGILRGFREAEDAYRRRLTLWVPTHRRAGTPFAIAEQVQAYFYPQVPTVHVIQHDPGAGGKPTRATWNTRREDGSETIHIESPSNWDYDSSDTTRPASLATRDPRVWIFIEQHANDPESLFYYRTSAEAATRDATAMNGALRPDGSAVPADQYRDLVALVEQWRAMGTWVAGVLVAFGIIDPTETGINYPDGKWYDLLDDLKEASRIPDSYRILYLNRFPGDRLPESPAPYP